MSKFFAKLHQAQNARDVFDLISWNTLEKLAAIPAFLFILSPVALLLHTSVQFWYLEQTIDSINGFVAILSCLLFLFSIAKYRLERQEFPHLQKQLVYFFFLSFVLLMLLSTLVNSTNLYNFAETWHRQTVLSYILYVFGYFGCTSFLVSASLKRKVIRLLQIVSIVQVFLVFFDRHCIQLEPFHRIQYKNTITSVFSNLNFYCYYLTVVLLLSATLFILERQKKWRIFDLICFLLNSFTLMRADTLGCFIAGAMGLLFLIVILRIIGIPAIKTAWLLLGCFIGLFLLNTLISSDLFNSFLSLFGDISKIIRNTKDAGSAGTGRWKLWTHTVQYITERPIFGWGFGGIFDRLEKEAGNPRPHNEYLEYAAFFGIPAALCYIAGVLSVFLRGLRYKQSLEPYTIAAFVGSFGYLVSACFGNTVYSVAPYFFCVLGLAVRVCKEDASLVRADHG